MADLFTIDRTERQIVCINKWKENKCNGVLLLPTGFGKTKVAIDCIVAFLSKNPGRRILIIVPSSPLKDQWISQLVIRGIILNCEVQIINTVIKHNWICDFLILDELHKYAGDNFGKVFTCVKYKIILGLTATLERADGKESYIEKYIKVVDTVTIEEAIKNNWLASYKEYKVLINVDLTEYKELNKEFFNHFSFFNMDFKTAMKCSTDWRFRNEYIKFHTSFMKTENDIKQAKQAVLIHAMGFNRTLQKRKAFINNHPKKIELTNLILSKRLDKKCITFSPTIGMAKKIAYGKVYAGKTSKKDGELILNEFLNLKNGVLNSSKKIDEGFDCPDVSVGIILGQNSSLIQKSQRIGRTIRKYNEKISEIFTLVINGTVENEWFRRSTKSKDFITIYENDLLNLLNGEEVIPIKNKETKMTVQF